MEIEEIDVTTYPDVQTSEERSYMIEIPWTTHQEKLTSYQNQILKQLSNGGLSVLLIISSGIGINRILANLLIKDHQQDLALILDATDEICEEMNISLQSAVKTTNHVIDKKSKHTTVDNDYWKDKDIGIQRMVKTTVKQRITLYEKPGILAITSTILLTDLLILTKLAKQIGVLIIFQTTFTNYKDYYPFIVTLIRQVNRHAKIIVIFQTTDFPQQTIKGILGDLCYAYYISRILLWPIFRKEIQENLFKPQQHISKSCKRKQIVLEDDRSDVQSAQFKIQGVISQSESMSRNEFSSSNSQTGSQHIMSNDNVGDNQLNENLDNDIILPTDCFRDYLMPMSEIHLKIQIALYCIFEQLVSFLDQTGTMVTSQDLLMMPVYKIQDLFDSNSYTQTLPDHQFQTLMTQMLLTRDLIRQLASKSSIQLSLNIKELLSSGLLNPTWGNRDIQTMKSIKYLYEIHQQLIFHLVDNKIDETAIISIDQNTIINTINNDLHNPCSVNPNYISSDIQDEKCLMTQVQIEKSLNIVCQYSPDIQILLNCLEQIRTENQFRIQPLNIFIDSGERAADWDNGNYDLDGRSPLLVSAIADYLSGRNNLALFHELSDYLSSIHNQGNQNINLQDSINRSISSQTKTSAELTALTASLVRQLKNFFEIQSISESSEYKGQSLDLQDPLSSHFTYCNDDLIPLLTKIVGITGEVSGGSLITSYGNFSILKCENIQVIVTPRLQRFHWRQIAIQYKPDIIILLKPSISVQRELMSLVVEQLQENKNKRPFLCYSLMHQKAFWSHHYLRQQNKERQFFEQMMEEKQHYIIQSICPSSRIRSQNLTINTRLGHLRQTRPTILIDFREFRSRFPSILYHEGFRIIPVQLPVADYILSPNLLIERKQVSTGDFYTSLQSGKLIKQLQNIRLKTGTAYLLVEFPDVETIKFDALVRNVKSRFFDSTPQIINDCTFMNVQRQLTRLTLQIPNLVIFWSRGGDDNVNFFRNLIQDMIIFDADDYIEKNKIKRHEYV